MSLIFVGDIAIPQRNSITLRSVPQGLDNQKWIGNLEGSLIKESGNELSEKKVFNSLDALKDLCKEYNFDTFVIANNHFLDAAPADTTVANIETLGVKHVGAGRNISEAMHPVDVTGGMNEYQIVAFGWDQINCTTATASTDGVNPHERKNVLKQVTNLLKNCNKRRIICFFHWDYELEAYPMPHDRGLAHKLIDMGVYAVIGCHSHRVQPIEVYKGHPIVYSLGNFLFAQNKYWNGQLKFKDYTLKEMAFELLDDGTFNIHWFEYDREFSETRYVSTDDYEKITKPSYSILNGMSAKEYKSFFVKNKVQNVLNPIYYYEDSELTILCKRTWSAALRGAKALVRKMPWIFSCLKKMINKEK